jgi:hypothetical protein
LELPLGIAEFDQSGTAVRVNFNDLFDRMELKSYLLEFYFAQPGADATKNGTRLLFCSKGFSVKTFIKSEISVALGQKEQSEEGMAWVENG